MVLGKAVWNPKLMGHLPAVHVWMNKISTCRKPLVSLCKIVDSTLPSDSA